MVGWDRRALKSWRQEKGLTQEGLAQALGVTPMAVAYWYCRKRRIPALLPLAPGIAWICSLYPQRSPGHQYKRGFYLGVPKGRNREFRLP